MHSLLDLRRYEKASTLHYITLHYLKVFFLSLGTVIFIIFFAINIRPFQIDLLFLGPDRPRIVIIREKRKKIKIIANY